LERFAAIYVRQSVEKEDSCSLEMQEMRCRALADVLGLPAKVYADPGKSGKDLDRPGFKLMMADVRAGKVETVIVYKLDRISRNLKDFFVLMDELQSLGVGFRSITENFDTTTPIGRATLGILAVFAQFERETTAQRVRDNMLDRARMGLWNGGPLPYGYTTARTEVTLGGKTKEVSVLEVDEERAEVVRRVFRDFLEGKGVRTIARELNTTGVAPARGTWTDQSVRRILQNPIYCAADQDAYGYFVSIGTETVCSKKEWSGATGVVVYNRRGPSGKTYKNNAAAKWIVSVGRHRPLVDGKSFVAVQKKLAAHALPPRTATGKRGLLVGLARCGSCGRAMSVSFSKKSKRDPGFAYMYYMCPGKGHGTCEGVRIRADKAEALVVDALIQVTADPDWERKLDAMLQEEVSVEQTHLQEKLAALTRQIEGLRNEEKNLIVALGRGTIRPELIESRLGEIAEEQKAKMAELEAVQAAVRESGARQVNIEFVRENLRRFRKEIFEEMSFEEKRAMLRSLIERVEVYPDKLVARVFAVGGLGSNGCSCVKVRMYCWCRRSHCHAASL
jgi:site-specific DNA recombinase